MGFARHHCRNQHNLRACHNHIQGELHEETDERARELQRKAESRRKRMF